MQVQTPSEATKGKKHLLISDLYHKMLDDSINREEMTLAATLLKIIALPEKFPATIVATTNYFVDLRELESTENFNTTQQTEQTFLRTQ